MPHPVDFALGRGCRFLCVGCGTFILPQDEANSCRICGTDWPQGPMRCEHCGARMDFRDPDTVRDGPTGDTCGPCTRHTPRIP